MLILISLLTLRKQSTVFKSFSFHSSKSSLKRLSKAALRKQSSSSLKQNVFIPAWMFFVTRCLGWKYLGLISWRTQWKHSVKPQSSTLIQTTNTGTNVWRFSEDVCEAALTKMSCDVKVEVHLKKKHHWPRYFITDGDGDVLFPSECPHVHLHQVRPHPAGCDALLLPAVVAFMFVSLSTAIHLLDGKTDGSDVTECEHLSFQETGVREIRVFLSSSVTHWGGGGVSGSLHLHARKQHSV